MIHRVMVLRLFRTCDACHPLGFPLQHLQHLVVNEFRQMQSRLLPDTHIRQTLFINTGTRFRKVRLISSRWLSLNFFRNLRDIFLLIGPIPAAGLHDLHDRRFGKKAEKCLCIIKPARNPSRVFVTESCKNSMPIRMSMFRILAASRSSPQTWSIKL